MILIIYYLNIVLDIRCTALNCENKILKYNNTLCTNIALLSLRSYIGISFHVSNERWPRSK